MRTRIRRSHGASSRMSHPDLMMGGVAALALAAGVASAQQQSYTYTGPFDGDWNSSGNWTPAGIPGNGPSDVAVILNGSRCRYGFAGPVTRVIDKLRVDAGGHLEMLNDFDLYIRGQSDGVGVTGLLTVPGTLQMSSVGNPTDLILYGGTFVTFGGESTSTPALIEMGNNANNRILGHNGSERLDIQTAAVIRGAGQVGANLISLHNEGAIVARGSTGLTIDPNSDGARNLGTLMAETGPLYLVSGAFDNTSGEVVANGGDVFLINCDLTGGVLNSTSAGGVVRCGTTGGGTYLHDISNQGVLRLPNDADFAAAGTITNTGTIQLQSVGNGTDIYLYGPLTLAGNGTIELSNSTENRFLDPAGYRGYVLSNAGNTIIGCGQIGLNSIDIVNQPTGSILAQGSAGLHLDPPTSMTNLGTLGAVSGGHLFLSYAAFNLASPAVAQDGGIVYLNGGSFTGTISSEGTGYCRLYTFGGTSVLNDLTNTGRLDLPNDNDAMVTGTLTNAGTINMLSVGNGTDLYIASPVTLTGAGSIVMSNSTENRIYDASGDRGFEFTNRSTIVGSGQIGLNTLKLANEPTGTIAAVGATGLYIDPAESMTNNGTLRADPGSRVEFRHSTYIFNTPAVAMDGGQIAFNGGSYSGSIDTQGAGVCRVISHGGSTVFDNVINLGLLELLNDHDVTIVNTLNNQGRVDLRSGGNATDMYIASNVSLFGGGTITMTNSGGNQIFDPSGDRGFTFTNVDNTISGAGRFSNNTINIVNQPAGSIIATLPAGFEIDPSASFTNHGVLRAESGSYLNFSHAAYNFVAPAVAGDGALVYLTSGSFSGTVNTEGSGAIRSNGYGGSVVLSSFTNRGNFVMANDFDLGVVGSIVNEGTIQLNSIGNATAIYLYADTTFSGGGTIELSDSLSNQIFDPAGDRGFTFTNLDNTITGAASIGYNTMNLVNAPNGRLLASMSSGIQVDAAGTVVNQGEMRASGGTFYVAPAASFTNSGVLAADEGRMFQVGGMTLRQTAGVTIANGEVQVDNDAFSLEGGLIIGSGRVDSTVTNIDGVVSPGNSTSDTASFAALTIEGNFNQSQTGETLIELGGPTVGTEYDRLVVTGVVGMGGALRIRLADGYAPVLGTVYDIITASAVVGGYDTIVAENIPFNNQLTLSFLGDRVRVIFDIRCLGDYDGDGGITGGDIAAFFKDFEVGAAAADLDQDGGITGGDIAEFFSRFEAGC